MNDRRRTLLGAAVGASLVLLFGAAVAAAQTYPTQTVRIIAPQPAGGLVDLAARLVQPQLEKSLKQTVIVENRPGAAGLIGTDAVAKATPDGHTLLVVAGSLTVVPATNPNAPYDVERDLAAVALLTKYSFLFMINAQLPAKSLPEFIALARKEPGKYAYASTGMGSLNHLITERLSQLAGIKLQHVPYRGAPPAMLAVAKGEVHLLAISPTVAMPHIQSGAARALASGGSLRDKDFPDVPTLGEAGLPGFEAVSWIGMLAPAATPKPIVARLNAEVNRALRDPDTIARFARQGSEVAPGSAETFQQMIAAEVRNWKDVARAANISVK
jgi:tripartite-type tricarboxylate transporter receptor subunit TctC